MENFNSAHILAVIDKLPHSKSRVPYTYHHDYLRQHSKMHGSMSRSEVSSSHTSSDIELYAIALTQLLSELGSEAVYHIGVDDLYVCKKAKAITNEAISRYNKEFKEVIDTSGYEFGKSVINQKIKVNYDFPLDDEVFTIIGEKEDKYEIQGDFSAGTNNVYQSAWINKTMVKEWIAP
jgi:hypothetical protein